MSNAENTSIASKARRALLYAPLALSILLAKISLPPIAAIGLGLGLPLILLGTAIAILLGAFRLHVRRLSLYLLLVIWACGMQFFGKTFSVLSLCFLLAILFPYVLVISEKRRRVEKTTGVQEAFARVGLVLAILGIVQYGAQFILGPKVAFPIEHLVPKGFLIESFNYLNAIAYGSPIFKSNGVFFLEPSFYSQFLAVVLLVELSGTLRLTRIMIVLTAMACTFSGTGLLVLGAGLAALTLIHRRFALIGIAILAGILILTFDETLGLTLFLERSREFSTVGTSGFDRFVSWTYMLQDQFWSDDAKVWTGNGAGTFAQQAAVARYSVWESSFAKMLYEYGLPGLFLYLSFLFYCIVSSTASTAVKAGLMTCIFMNGPYSEFNAGIFLTLALWSTSGHPAVGKGETARPSHPKKSKNADSATLGVAWWSSRRLPRH